MTNSFFAKLHKLFEEHGVTKSSLDATLSQVASPSPVVSPPPAAPPPPPSVTPVAPPPPPREVPPPPRPPIPPQPSHSPAPIYSSSPAYYVGGATPYYSDTASDAGPLNSLDPLRLLQIGRKKWLTILLTACFCVGASFYFLSKATRFYQSTATVELSVRRPRILNKQDAVIEDAGGGMQSEDTFNTQVEKFRRQAVFPFVMSSYRELYPEDTLSDPDLKMKLGGGAGFMLVRRTRLVRVSFVSDNRSFVIKACNAYAAGVEASVRAENRASSDAAVAWLEAQAKVQKGELDNADQALLLGRQEFKMDALEAQRKTVQNALLHFNDALTIVESKVALEQKMLDLLMSLELHPEKVGDLPAEIPRVADVNSSMERWRVSLTERDALLSRYTRQHPTVEAQEKTVALFQAQALSALERARSTAAANVDLYKGQAKNLLQKKEAQLKLSSNLEGDILNAGMKISSLERARTAADMSNLGVLSRIQEARLSADENTATIKLVESANKSLQIQPRPVRSLATALLLGLLLGCVLAFIADFLEDHVVGAKDIEVGMGVKILGTIPHAKTKSRQEIATTSLTHRFSELSEAFAGLRSVLNSALYFEHTKMILIASSLPEEGKTITCSNLAITFALNGQKTLLIDFDLRRPRMGGIFSMPAGTKGLLEYLTSVDTNPAEIAYSSACNNMDIIASRVVEGARPAEFVGGAKVADLLAWARQHYDRILIDGPPLGLVSDALSLAGLADCVLVMARPDTSRKRAVRHTIRRFRDVGVGNIAVVMNDVDHTKFTYHGYGPYYHYKKQYGAYAAAVATESAKDDDIQTGHS